MKYKSQKTISDEQKKFSESLRINKDVWQDMYSALGAYTKEFEELFDNVKHKESKSILYK